MVGGVGVVLYLVWGREGRVVESRVERVGLRVDVRVRAEKERFSDNEGVECLGLSVADESFVDVLGKRRSVVNALS